MPLLVSIEETRSSILLMFFKVMFLQAVPQPLKQQIPNSQSKWERQSTEHLLGLSVTVSGTAGHSSSGSGSKMYNTE